VSQSDGLPDLVLTLEDVRKLAAFLARRPGYTIRVPRYDPEARTNRRTDLHLAGRDGGVFATLAKGADGEYFANV
jgi:hypothetical protein